MLSLLLCCYCDDGAHTISATEEPPMSIYGKKIGEYVSFARTGMILIVLMGLARFFVGISGVPYERATHHRKPPKDFTR